MKRIAKHLKKETIIKNGVFYTPFELVKIVYELIQKHKINYDFVCDVGAGCGDFIREEDKSKFIYVDIDDKAMQICHKKHGKLFKYLKLNALHKLNRRELGIKNSNLLIVGNPPYNNLTSFFQNGKKGKMLIKEELKTNDLGISFLRMYETLKAESICVLHPLSYLVKKTNFLALKKFRENYSLIDNWVVSSKVFKNKSSKTPFPILIGLYKRSQKGMSFEWIKQLKFKVFGTNYKFSLNQFMYIEEHHTKYKNKHIVGEYSHFYTLRDMNWLSINKTWLEEESTNSIRIKLKDRKIFEYIDQLKRWYLENKEKYYFLGNLSPIIIEEFLKKKDIKQKSFNDFFERELTSHQPCLQVNNDELIWIFTGIVAGGKYRFKDKEDLFSNGQILPSASKPVNKNSFLEIQIAYDKDKKEFYKKPSLKKIIFQNNKDKNKFMFELSEIARLALEKKWKDRENFKRLLFKIKDKNSIFLEDKFQIKRQEPKKITFFDKLDFYTLPIIKPGFILKLFKGDFVEIKIDYKQKASGTQAMLFFNISAQNLAKGDKSIIGQQVRTKDQLEYKIDKEVFNKVFWKIIFIFSKLSRRHRDDISGIIQRILNYSEKEKNL